MPQELHVVRCYQCKTFQSDIVKKVKKWTCKLCGSKQSLVKEFARGTGRECRLLVQQLSERAIKEQQLEQTVAQQVLAGVIELPEAQHSIHEESERLLGHDENRQARSDGGSSKWGRFHSEEEEEDNHSLFKINSKPKKRPAVWSKEHEQCAEPKRNYDSFQTSKTVQFSQSSSLPPLADFHQMNRSEKKKFKWQSRSSYGYNHNNEISRSVNSPSTELSPPKASFKPKIPTDVKKHSLQSEENESIVEANTPTTQSQLMNFGKRSKWGCFEHKTDEEVSCLVSNQTQSKPSNCNPDQINILSDQTETVASKWSKFVTEDEDD